MTTVQIGEFHNYDTLCNNQAKETAIQHVKWLEMQSVLQTSMSWCTKAWLMRWWLYEEAVECLFSEMITMVDCRAFGYWDDGHRVRVRELLLTARFMQIFHSVRVLAPISLKDKKCLPLPIGMSKYIVFYGLCCSSSSLVFCSVIFLS